MANLIAGGYWQPVAVLVYSTKTKRLPVTLPPLLVHTWVRVDIRILVPAPDFYRAGWLSQVASTPGKDAELKPNSVPLLLSSLHQMNSEIGAYKLRFSPVKYLPNCLVNFHQFKPFATGGG